MLRCVLLSWPDALVAQLDRVLPSEGRGHWFDSSRVRHFTGQMEILEYEDPFMKEMPTSTISKLTPEQISLIELNLELSVEERIEQLQNAVSLIEEMRTSLKEANENRFQNSHK